MFSIVFMFACVYKCSPRKLSSHDMFAVKVEIEKVLFDGAGCLSLIVAIKVKTFFPMNDDNIPTF